MTAETHASARRAALGTAANVAGQLIVALSFIVLTPLIVHRVGPADYGVWVLFGTIGSFAVLLELGVAAALVRYVADHAARGETQEAALMVGTATWIYAIGGAFLVAISVLLGLCVPAVIHLHGAFARLVRPLACLVGLNLGISMVAIAPMALLRGLQRYSVANAIIAAGAVVTICFTIAALMLHLGIAGVAGAAAASSGVVYAGSLLVVRQIAPAYMTTPLRPDRDRARRLLSFSGAVAVTQLAFRLQTRLDAVVIAVALPVRLLAPYNFSQSLASGTGMATDQFGKVLLPMASEFGASREPGVLRRMFLTSTRLTMAIAFGVGLPIAVLGGPILRLWVGPAYAGYGSIVAILTMAAIVDLPSYSAAAILQGIARHGPIAWMALSSGVINVLLSIALVIPFGLAGVAWGTLIASAVEIPFLVVPYALRVLEIPRRTYAAEVGVRLIPAIALLLALLLAGQALLPVTSLFRLVVVVAVAASGYAIAYCGLGADSYERSAYRNAATAAWRLRARLWTPGGGPTASPPR